MRLWWWRRKPKVGITPWLAELYYVEPPPDVRLERDLLELLERDDRTTRIVVGFEEPT